MTDSQAPNFGVTDTMIPVVSRSATVKLPRGSRVSLDIVVLAEMKRPPATFEVGQLELLY